MATVRAFAFMETLLKLVGKMILRLPLYCLTQLQSAFSAAGNPLMIQYNHWEEMGRAVIDYRGEKMAPASGQPTSLLLRLNPITSSHRQETGIDDEDQKPRPGRAVDHCSGTYDAAGWDCSIGLYAGSGAAP